MNSSCHPSPFLTCLYLQSLLGAGQGIVYFFYKAKKNFPGDTGRIIFLPFSGYSSSWQSLAGLCCHRTTPGHNFCHSCPHYPPIWSSVKPKTRETSVHSPMEAFSSHCRAVPVLPSSFFEWPIQTKKKRNSLDFLKNF